MIRLAKLKKNYGDFAALRGIDLEVSRGSLFGLLGPNGAGKTTALRIIAGILQPTAGRVIVAGHDVQRDPERAKSKLGFIPDRPFVYDKLTGQEFLKFVGGLWGQDGAEVDRRIDELLNLWELTDWRDELLETYSHGMRQKIIISSALIHKPDVIIVDEPMVGLDPKAARILKDLFRGFVKRGGTILMSTHTLEVAEVLCDSIAIIQNGLIRAQGSMEDLRAEAEAGEAGLEEIFLKLTGGQEVQELLEVLES
ncbi:MAG: ABC transporter ATP-binding protein [Candidatus Palauibacterales bacterium]|nr:ABC transporter ATP-binding protein [Candidatus Palauibacterales bacterium]